MFARGRFGEDGRAGRVALDSHGCTNQAQGFVSLLCFQDRLNVAARWRNSPTT